MEEPSNNPTPEKKEKQEFPITKQFLESITDAMLQWRAKEMLEKLESGRPEQIAEVNNKLGQWKDGLDSPISLEAHNLPPTLLSSVSREALMACLDELKVTK